MKNVNIVICGAGISGIATAWSLAVKNRQKKIVLIDKNQPMSLTTSKSGENFRDYWPQPWMTALTRRSIALMQALAEDSGNAFEMGWAYNREPELPKWETSDDFDFPNITLRGASRFIPALSTYVHEPPTPVVQFSGYYTRTPENLPLIGPLEPAGLFTVSAMAGYGTMAACSAAELCANWMTGGELPEYAAYFHPDRYKDVTLMAEINRMGSDGQL